jgi:hypothetical protein
LRRHAAIALAVFVAAACIGLVVESQAPAVHTRAAVVVAAHHSAAHPDQAGGVVSVLAALAALAWWTLAQREQHTVAVAPVRTPWRRRGPPSVQ